MTTDWRVRGAACVAYVRHAVKLLYDWVLPGERERQQALKGDRPMTNENWCAQAPWRRISEHPPPVYQRVLVYDGLSATIRIAQFTDLDRSPVVGNFDDGALIYDFALPELWCPLPCAPER